MLALDLQNAVEKSHMSGPNNFTVLLFRLLLKADAWNLTKMKEVYPVEVEMALIFKTECPYFPTDHEGEFRRVNWNRIEQMARERTEQ